MKTVPSSLVLRFSAGCLAGALTLWSAIPLSAAGKKKKADEEPVPETILAAPIKVLSGPKRVVAVGKFDCLGSFRQNFGDWDIGGGMAAMLATALSESEQFIVLERAYLSQVLSEQELKGQKTVLETTGPKLGQVTGAQLLVYGAITEFGAENSGGGFSIGIAGLPGGLKAGLGPQFTKGKVSMDVRIVDTTTGRIVSTYKVNEKLKGTSWDLSFGKDKVTMGNNFFKKTPLGEACRRAITQVVQKFADSAEKQPWQGRIVDIDGADVSINAGARSGVKQGDKFTVFRVLKVIHDPDTGVVLSRKEQPMGALEVIKVEEALSSGIYVPEAGSEEPAPVLGDLVRQLVP